MKMSYYLFNRQELLQKLKDRYHNGGGKKTEIWWMDVLLVEV